MQFKKTLTLGALAVALSGMFAGAASATTYFNDFSGLGVQLAYPGNRGYSQGGITVQYVGTFNDFGIFTGPWSASSNYSWYPNAGGIGYDAVTLTGGGAFNSVTISAGTGGGGDLQYRLLNGSTVVATGDAGFIALGSPVSRSFTFTGNFTEADFQNLTSGPPPLTFSPRGPDALAILSLTIATNTANSPGPVPGAGLFGLALLLVAGAATTARGLLARSRRF